MERQKILSTLNENLHLVVTKSRDKELVEDSSLVADYGADSIQIVEVVSRTMRGLRVRVPRTQLSQAKTVGELVDLFVANA